MPRTFSAAFAGEELASRPRTFISMVLETVIAAVPASPANKPFPMLCASVVIICPLRWLLLARHSSCRSRPPCPLLVARKAFRLLRLAHSEDHGSLKLGYK